MPETESHYIETCAPDAVRWARLMLMRDSRKLVYRSGAPSDNQLRWNFSNFDRLIELTMPDRLGTFIMQVDAPLEEVRSFDYDLFAQSVVGRKIGAFVFHGAYDEDAFGTVWHKLRLTEAENVVHILTADFFDSFPGNSESFAWRIALHTIGEFRQPVHGDAFHYGLDKGVVSRFVEIIVIEDAAKAGSALFVPVLTSYHSPRPS